MVKLFGEESGFYAEPSYVPQDPAQATQPQPIPVSVVVPVAAAPPAATPVAQTSSPAIVTPPRAPTALSAPDLVPRPRYSQADYARAAMALLPRGRIWSADDDGVQGRLMSAVAASFERIDGVANGLLEAALPGSVTPLLPEWEASLGLPDPCAGAEPSVEARAHQVRGRFAGLGGPSRAAVIDFAAALGFTIEIVNYSTFRVGYTSVENPVAGEEWAFAWAVRVLATTGSLPLDVLACELQATRPAETILILLQ